MPQTIQQRIERARQILSIARHATMATVNKDGSPHNTPFRFLHDKNLRHVYWGSHPHSKHSKNVERTGKIFVVLYDMVESGGLYIEAENARALSGRELKSGLAIHNKAYAKVEGKEPVPIEYYDGSGSQRLYAADIKRLWIPVSKKDSNELVIRDSRYEIRAKDLLG